MDNSSSHRLTLRGDDGVNVTVDMPRSDLSDDQSSAVGKLFREGSPRSLSREEWESIKDLRARARGDFGPSALIVRFDWKWVRIDEAGLSFEDMQNL